MVETVTATVAVTSWASNQIAPASEPERKDSSQICLDIFFFRLQPYRLSNASLAKKIYFFHYFLCPFYLFTVARRQKRKLIYFKTNYLSQLSIVLILKNDNF